MFCPIFFVKKIVNKFLTHVLSRVASRLKFLIGLGQVNPSSIFFLNKDQFRSQVNLLGEYDYYNINNFNTQYKLKYKKSTYFLICKLILIHIKSKLDFFICYFIFSTITKYNNVCLFFFFLHCLYWLLTF